MENTDMDRQTLSPNPFYNKYLYSSVTVSLSDFWDTQLKKVSDFGAVYYIIQYMTSYCTSTKVTW